VRGFGLSDPAFLALLTPSGIVLPNIGDPFQGGFFAGLISHTADGNATHALIVAPAATGATGTGYPVTTNLAWKTTNTDTPGAFSEFDGVANMTAIIAAGIVNHPAAQFCHDLVIDGYDDWYLPSRLELEIAYFNLKPTTDLNFTSSGINAYAVPPRASNYPAAGPPVQTTVAAFQGPSGSEHFRYGGNLTHANTHIPSNQEAATSIRRMHFLDGGTTVSNGEKTRLTKARAFRRIAL
jgi:hypothetical protein